MSEYGSWGVDQVSFENGSLGWVEDFAQRATQLHFLDWLEFARPWVLDEGLAEVYLWELYGVEFLPHARLGLCVTVSSEETSDKWGWSSHYAINCSAAWLPVWEPVSQDRIPDLRPLRLAQDCSKTDGLARARMRWFVKGNVC